jgi:hypothetical protein
VGRDSSVGTATRYGLDGPGIESRWVGETRFSSPIQTGPGAHPASHTMGTGSFPGVKRPGRGVDHPPPSSAEVKGRVQLYLYSPSGPSWPVLGWPLPLPLLHKFWMENRIGFPMDIIRVISWPVLGWTLPLSLHFTCFDPMEVIIRLTSRKY